jgi:hypothetical protein
MYATVCQVNLAVDDLRVKKTTEDFSPQKQASKAVQGPVPLHGEVWVQHVHGEVWVQHVPAAA